MVCRGTFEGIVEEGAFLDNHTMVNRLEVSIEVLEVVHHRAWQACILSIVSKDRWAIGNTFIFKFI
jgi:hypothetical protein